MTYKRCLKPWAVTRQLPNLRWVIIARYRSRSDADGHLVLLRQRVPNLQFKVVFDLLDFDTPPTEVRRILSGYFGTG